MKKLLCIIFFLATSIIISNATNNKIVPKDGHPKATAAWIKNQYEWYKKIEGKNAIPFDRKFMEKFLPKFLKFWELYEI